MNRILNLSVVAAIFLGGCESEQPINKFTDPVMVKIADLQDKRSVDSLYTFFNHSNPAYRRDAVLAFASIQDSSSVARIGEVLNNDTDTLVRQAAAFALGQTKSSNSANLLREALSKEKSVTVQSAILEGYGKTTKKWNLNPAEIADRKGLAWSLYYAGLDNRIDTTHYRYASLLLEETENENTRLGAAHFFARAARDISKQLPVIINTAMNDASAEVRMAAVAALRKSQADTAFSTIEKIIRDDQDYRVRVNAIRALQPFPFEKSRNALLDALSDKNVNASIAASEVILASATETFWIELANRVTDIRDWRIQANLYAAILKVKENPGVINEIKALYQRSTNPYQKAALLTALQQTPSSVDLIEQELLKADTPVVRTAAAGALVAINRSKKFNSGLKSKFVDIYKKAVESGDAAIIGIVAETLGDSLLGYREVISDYSFLMQAREKLSLPKDNEALQPLEAAIALFERRKSPEVQNEFNHPIDWDLVKSIPKDQRVVIKTSRGYITVRLLVEEAPGSVANFVSLARQNYFDNKLFHRVVPNFVVQAGCNRGDGWGSEDYSIRSEFSANRYKTGSVGMASAGKDTEGTQWFITHSPTPHLNGRYTIFAEVQDGMEVVHLLEVGDQIIDVELESKSDE